MSHRTPLSGGDFTVTLVDLEEDQRPTNSWPSPLDGTSKVKRAEELPLLPSARPPQYSKRIPAAMSPSAVSVSQNQTVAERGEQTLSGGSFEDEPSDTVDIQITPQYRRKRYEQRKLVFSCCLAALSGFCDVLCKHIFGCYGNMMTGNTITLLDDLTAGRWREATFYAALVPSYILGASLCAMLSKLDLTVLGLGGPSSAAFAHLNPPRRLRSPQQISVLRVVAAASTALFLAGELFVRVLSPDTLSRVPLDKGGIGRDFGWWRLPFFACAFGLLNAATLSAIHLVTNAVTGHWITVGLGVADDLPVLINRQSSGRLLKDGDDHQSQAPKHTKAPQTDAPKPWKTSILVAASFITAIALTSIVYNECLRQLQHDPDRLLAWCFRLSPPMGVVFATLYTALLYWYTLPPPFLRGYSSRVDLLVRP